MKFEEYNRLKRAVEDRRREYDREKGAYEETLKSLKEMGLPSLKEAEKKLLKLRVLIKAEGRSLAKDLKRFLKKHPHVLNNH